MTEKQPVISIRNITKRFGNMVAVDDVSLDIFCPARAIGLRQNDSAADAGRV